MPGFNFLPYRALRQQQQRYRFYLLLIISGMMGLLLALGVSSLIEKQVAKQRYLHQLILKKSQSLDEKIANIAHIKQQIALLNKRYHTMQMLASEQNHTIHLLQELAQLTPPGISLNHLQQDDSMILLHGHASSNAHIANILQNFNDKSHWLRKPVLLEIRTESDNKNGAYDQRLTFSMQLDGTLLTPRPMHLPPP